MRMAKSKLKLNPYKAEFIIIGSKKQRDNFSTLWPILLLDHEMSPSNCQTFGYDDLSAPLSSVFR